MFAGRRLGLNHDLTSGDMNGDVESRAAVHEHAAEQTFDGVTSAQHGDAVAQIVNRPRSE
ncbi:hypothetical protein D3C87_1349240 [compost metagenome]